ncbi:hypothetical protein P875_00086797 [Aspergillus parasiticus SU-1]|uniref:Uncharacterized protein n=1 Tax=Aspergillus parasiticus (strain ATCC 56775 / NRRL 5862 / SRRC 143 / SU-1) TaxID=1403190 RepID=A0A0F0I399_ASPPU|nr:hypothetical protein P875_00086797 [Aspergillus parasiticus SU-1]
METLDQAVSEGDLILLYAPGKRAIMLLVLSSPGSQISNPKIWTIFVRQVKVDYLDEPGRCVVSGPDVHYNEEDDHTSEDDSTSEDDDLFTEASSESILSTFVARYPVESENGSILTLSHSDVLKYYWGGNCPFCYGHGWYCPGCGPAQLFPDLFGGCSVDQSCPVCLGFDFAMEDKIQLREVEEYEDRLAKGECPFGFLGELAELKGEILEMVRERYELIDARRQEMGLSGYDVDDIVESWFPDGDDE